MSVVWVVEPTDTNPDIVSQAGKEPVRSVYMVPVLALASAAKQNISCMLHASCWGINRSTLAHAATLLFWMLRMEAALDWCLRM